MCARVVVSLVRDTIMETRQARYKKTKKGQKRQSEAQQRYLASRKSWQTYLSFELSEQLENHKPEGMSKSDFLESVVIPFYLKNFQTNP